MALVSSTKAFDAGRIKGTTFIANAVELDVVWNIVPTKQVKNVMHGIVAGGFSATAAIAQAIYASILASAAWTAYKAYVNSACSLQGIYLRDIRGPTQVLPLVLSTGAATPGTGAAQALPPNVNAVIKLSTAVAGRNGRGRIYLPGLDSVALNAATGNFSAAFQTAAQNFVAQIATSALASGVTLAVANPARQAFIGRTGTAHVARAAGLQATTGYNMLSLTPRTQRRRGLTA
jgi:hypothetical protein